MVKVHYFFDPMCGWCYGATPLIKEVADMLDMDLTFHPGGMIPKREIDPGFRQYILQADERIEQKSKMEFGDAYKTRVASADPFVLDSYITTQAFLVGQDMGIKPHIMLKAIQEAYYQKGEALDQPEALKKLAVSLGLDAQAWENNMANAKPRLMKEIENSHIMMKDLNVSGYPSLILEMDGEFQVLPISSYYGRVVAWKELLKSLL